MADKKKNNQLSVRERAELQLKKNNAPAKKGKEKEGEKRPNVFVRMYNFISLKLKGMWSELKKVTWPTAKHSWKQTTVVIVVVLFFLAALMLVDTAFISLLNLLPGRP